jgi:hypothetical protein
LLVCIASNVKWQLEVALSRDSRYGLSFWRCDGLLPVLVIPTGFEPVTH